MTAADHSFAIFVYPFCFERTRFDGLVRAADGDGLAAEGGTWPVWVRRGFPRDDLLRQVADYLNPAPAVPATACLWGLDQRVLTSPRGLGLRAGAAFLALRHRGGAADNGDPRQPPQGALGIDVEAVELALFRVGTGCLMLSVRARSAAPEDWFDLLNGLRHTDRPGQVDLLLYRRLGPDRSEPFTPPLLGDAAGDRLQPRHLLAALLRRLAGPLAQPTTVPYSVPDLDPATMTGGDWWQEVFVPGQMLPFHALFLSGVPEAERPLVLYRLRNFFRSAQPIVPAAVDLDPAHPALLAHAEGMWFSLTPEGGGFVAFDAPDTPFWSGTMPAHLREQYFLLFLFALHQRFALMHLGDQVCAGWLGAALPAAEAHFADLREALIDFTARGNFQQIMQREHHQRCFAAWRVVFATDRLYREVSDAVREVHDLLLMRKTERLRQLAEAQQRLLAGKERADATREKAAEARAERLGLWFGAIALLLGFPSLALAYLQVLGGASAPVAWAAIIAAMVIGGALLLGIRLWLHRRAHRDAG